MRKRPTESDHASGVRCPHAVTPQHHRRDSINGTRRLVDALLARQALAQLKARDQLGIAMRQGEAFAVRGVALFCDALGFA